MYCLYFRDLWRTMLHHDLETQDSVFWFVQDAKDAETLANLVVCSLHLGKSSARYLKYVSVMLSEKLNIKNLNGMHFWFAFSKHIIVENCHAQEKKIPTLILLNHDFVQYMKSTICCSCTGNLEVLSWIWNLGSQTSLAGFRKKVVSIEMLVTNSCIMYTSHNRVKHLL